MTREATLRTALTIVTGNRNADYGPPERNLETIAKLWSTYLSARAGVEIRIEPHDVAVMNILQKVSRVVQTPEKEDTWTDIAGYAACGAEVATEPKRS
jgi:hypothetical protein